MDYTGMKVLVMGLGLNGGGYEAALYFYKRGATLTVTDLKDEAALAPTIEKLDAACREIKAAGAIRYVLGRHELDDFKAADLTIKNPGARPDSPFLQAAKKIETDISVFLAACPARIFAVTGSKGKSTTSAALHWILQKIREEGAPAFPGRAYLGGNIAISPLSFLDELDEDDDVVLELSSFQLGDLRGRRDSAGRALLKPKVSVITCIMKDHLDRYGTMENYVADKKVIYAGQDEGDIAVTKDDEWGQVFRGESRARQLIHAGSPLEKGISGGWAGGEGPGFARLYRGGGFKGGGETAELVPARPLTPGAHQKRNLLAAALGVYALGADAAAIKNALKNFAGVEHRLEFFCEWENNRFYNDSAATIPEAAAAAVNALAGGDRKLVLVAGGTDKDLDYSPLAAASKKAAAVILLAGTGSDKLAAALKKEGVVFAGAFDNIEAAAAAALEATRRFPGCNVALSPGATSFGMFQNEFDRGRRWKDAVRRLVGQ